MGIPSIFQIQIISFLPLINMSVPKYGANKYSINFTGKLTGQFLIFINIWTYSMFQHDFYAAPIIVVFRFRVHCGILSLACFIYDTYCSTNSISVNQKYVLVRDQISYDFEKNWIKYFLGNHINYLTELNRNNSILSLHKSMFIDVEKFLYL